MITLRSDELIVDCFAGGGGASEGIYMATGRHPDVAINHDPKAIAMHKANHPETEHYCKSVYHVDPDDIMRKYKRRIGFAWFSPDCTHHSRARGGKPKEKHIRDLAWTIVLWAERAVYNGLRIRKIAVENVTEFQDWCPLLPDGQPDLSKKGSEFRRWIKAMRKLGYKEEYQALTACDYGSNTSRTRLVIIFCWQGETIAWPEKTHGPGRAEPYGTAAECIDWSISCPSIFMTQTEAKKLKIKVKRPLAEPTMRRVAHGIKRFVLDAKEPFIVSLTHQGGDRNESLSEPIRTITGAHRGEKALVMPSITKFRTGSIGSAIDEPLHTITAGGNAKRPAGHPHAMGLVEAMLAPIITEHANASNPRSWSADEPMRTQCAQVKGGHFALAGASLVQMGYGESEGQAPRSLDPEKLLGTIVSGGKKHAVAVGFLAQHNNHADGGVNVGRSLESPVSTITASGSQQGLVTGHLVKLRGTCRHGQAVDEPMPTVSAQGTHLGAVTGNLIKYYGTDQAPDLSDPLHTITSKDRFGFVESGLTVEPLSEAQLSRAREVAALMRYYGLWDYREFVSLQINGVTYIIADIGLRMLSRRELFNAQGFPRTYIIAPMIDGKPMSNTDSVRMVGNSVPPDMACAVTRALWQQQPMEMAA